jgi:hypothetical protein
MAHWTFDGNGNYNNASGDVNIILSKANATIVVNGYSGSYDGTAHGATGTATGVGGVNLGAGLNLGASFTNVPGGTAHWTFSGGTNYNDANGDAAIVIDKANQTITFAALTNKILGDPDFNVSASANSGLPVSFTASPAGVCTMSGSTVHLIGVGTCTITASQAGNGNYNAASSVARSFSVTYMSAGMCLGSANHAILQPINSDGTSVSKQGSTVPAKFRVCDANNNSIGTPGVVASFRLVATITGTAVDIVNEPVDSTTPDTAFRWDATDKQWIYNINTKSLAKNKTYVYLITLNDGSTIQFQFGLK